MFKTMPKSQSGKELSSGCLALFGLPFLLAGLFMSWLYVSGYTKWLQAQRWEEIPCWIESAELKINHDDSTTYQATAKYRYEYKGRTYRGDRVSFGAGSDNIGDFQRQAHRELSRHVEKKAGKAERDPGQKPVEPFRCYVNPGNPGESVLYRTLRWQMQAFMALFALSFPAIGAGLVVGGMLASANHKRETGLRAQHPGEPWKWKTIWAGASIAPSGTLWHLALFVYTIWSGLVIVPLILAAATTGAFQRDSMSWLLMIFPALWLIPLGFAVRNLRRKAALGAVRFEMQEMPAWPGGTLRGSITCPKPLPLRGSVELSLTCTKSITRSSGDGSSTTTETIWSHRENVPQERVVRDFSGFRLPVSITLPADAPESGETGESSTRHDWKLELKVPGTVIRTGFEVPVFRTGQSPVREILQSSVPSIDEVSAADLPARLAERRIQAEFDDAGIPVSIVCPPSRNLQLVLFLVFFNLIWTAVAVFLIRADNVPMLFRIVWPGSSAIIWLVLLWNLLHKRASTFGSDALEVRNQLGPVVWTKKFEKNRIVSFQHGSNMSSNNTNFYKVWLTDVTGKKKTLADNITSSTTAAALVKRLDAWKNAS